MVALPADAILQFHNVTKQTLIVLWKKEVIETQNVKTRKRATNIAGGGSASYSSTQENLNENADSCICSIEGNAF